ncbi:zinc-dependent metalloprotease [Limnoglobus roseus]|uniref:DUF5117 domain-containing protein n=1 Tax=Limnoglobus roseus TaxID=2598579 RepID=A0A5C1AFJ5_9BACT|nr:zinc-dependent metalloprotease [Limnoglobus roseus]QEL17355.1 hypothetical protein PX52LOC_04338 [Limnoglobus roseus]
MSLRRLAALTMGAGLVAIATGPAVSQSPTPAPAAMPEKKFPDFESVVRGAKVSDGLFTLHHKDENVFAEITPFQLDHPFLMPISVVRGAGMGGSTLNFDEQWVVLFKRVGDKVHLVRRNVRFTAKSGTPAAKAVETTYADSVLMALPIKALNPMKGSILIDLNTIFFGDLAELGLGSLDTNRTTWGKIKAFKKNVELQVQATFNGSRRRMFSGADDVIDGRGTTVTVQYGFVELPDFGYQPRYADNRVGHFLSAVKDFSKENPDTSFVRMVNRWRLERPASAPPWKDGGKLVPPVKPIVFWIENSVPEEFRTAVREGILEWNKAFEKIGFKNAIEVRQQEAGEFDPEDITYSTFRWIASDVPFAIGPSRANPLTGEILDADILFDASYIQYYKTEQRIFRDDKGRLIEPVSDIRASQKGWDLPLHPLAFRGSPLSWNDKDDGAPITPEARQMQRLHAIRNGYCQCAAHKRGELAMAVMSAAVGVVKDGEKVPDELLQQAVKETTMHEVGHTLGLRHNFKASTMLPNEKLHDTTITRKQGLVGSVMDYNPANIAPPGVKQGDYFTTTLGPYDYWAIEYAYRPISGGTEGELSELKKIASKVADPNLVYGTDEDVFGSADPFINRWDLGADPMQFGKDRIKVAQDLLGKLADKAVENGESYSRLRLAFNHVMQSYGNAAFLTARHVGGIVVNRDFKGDPNGRDPLVPVKADKQREALTFLKDNILTDKPFAFPPELLRKLVVQKWSHWGTKMSFGGGEYPVNEKVLAIQETVLDELLDGGTLARLQNSARMVGKDEKPVMIAEVFRTLTDSIFTDLPTDGKVSSTKSSVVLRNLQRAYLGRLANMVVGSKNDGGSFVIFLGNSDVPPDARSLARKHLRDIGKRIDESLKAGGKGTDDEAVAFLEESKERIAKILDAKVTANEP